VADSVALRSMRARRHRDGDHSLCRHGPEVGVHSEPAKLVAAILEEFPADDDMSRQLALRLAELAGGAAPPASRLSGRWVSWSPTSGTAGEPPHGSVWRPRR
jgi:hypothetical protein